jgi:ABC-type Fe3+/spermidine/putrescine transport system ATPase subunit
LKEGRGALRIRSLSAPHIGPIDLDLQPGAYACLLGPEGAGKTRTLRAIAGLDRSTGSITLDATPIDRLPPRRRTLALLGAHNSLAPFATIGAALRAAQTARGLTGPSLARRRETLLDAWHLDPRADPQTLDAEHRLRARLAAALASEPRLLLLDDPLSTCPTPQAVIDQLRAAAAEASLTVLHATPRTDEAFALADTLILLDAGTVLQQGPAASLYERPNTLAIARRLGPANTLQGAIESLEDDIAQVRLDCGPLIEADPPETEVAPGVRCTVLIRPEQISVSPLTPAELGPGAIAAVLRSISIQGGAMRLVAAVGTDADLLITRPAALGTRGLIPGRTISLAWQSRHARTFLE